MSQYGYGYGPPQGYQPPNVYSHLPPPSYSGPLYNTGEASHAQRSSQSGAALESFKQHRQTIPGLGLNFSSSTVGWQQPWANGPHEFPSGQAHESRGENGPPPTNAATNIPSQTKSNISGVDAMEEGELSEGELEDIYEPGQIDCPQGNQPTPVTLPAAAQRQPREPANQSMLKIAPKDSQSSHHWEPEQPTRERSGSYSPYLSPREIHSNDQGSSPEVIETPRSEARRTEIGSAVLEKLVGSEGKTDQLGEPQIKTVAEVKKQAQEAILRLWPLNVRYQNYIEEGIDKTLLDGLFSELGLDSAMAQLLTQSVPPSAVAAQDNANKTLDDGNESRETEKTGPGSQDTGKPKDKSEERKDRIARLLAAKGSKPSIIAAEPAPTVPTVPKATPQVPTAPRAHGLTKTQSEKSKLIQQKMEALRKAREANAIKTPQSQPPTTPAAEGNITRPASLPSAPVPSYEVDSGPFEPTVVSSQLPETLERSDSNGTPSIPGLFLSSTPQPSPAVNQRKRPVASDLNEFSNSGTYKRPFGQNRESRPFLIDVSDDEDDAEMEIDSPEQRPASIHRPVTPSKTNSFRDHPALADSLPNRPYSSPKPAATPTGPATGGNGLYDLESMNKKIEDMKRKIAEAEARKKAKQSSNDTPSLPQSQGQSKEGSVDAPSVSQPIPKSHVVPGNEGEESGQSTPLISRPASPASLKLPKVRGQRKERRSPLRLRIASERLPILEAHRKDQMEQLQRLQTEVARIEKEIQDNIKEEARLRDEVMELEADQVPQDDSEPEAVVLCESRCSVGTSRLESRRGPSIDSTSSRELTPSPAEPLADSATQFLKEIFDASSSDSSTNRDQEDAPDVPEPAENPDVPADIPVHDNIAQVSGSVQLEDVVDTVANISTVDQTIDSPKHATPSVTAISTPEGNDQVEQVDSNSDPDTDVAMDEDADSDSEDEEGELSDDYEPTETGVELLDHQSPRKSSPTPPSEEVVLETSDTDLQGVSETSPIAQQISAAEVHSTSVSESGREVEQPTEPSDSGAPKSTFVPYETPLSSFRAYRFHPEYKDSVAGGLRSLTYSNKIDAKREVCPDELVSGVCPRGKECEFQHFDNMKAPDDQILLQLGAYGNYEGDQKQQYIAGLRDLLTDFRNRKIKDFQAISEGIIEYRAKFHGDKTKILPLGNVAL